MYLSLEGMPLGSPEQVMSAWRFVHLPMVRSATTAGEVVMAKDRIQYAAVEFGMGMFREPECTP